MDAVAARRAVLALAALVITATCLLIPAFPGFWPVAGLQAASGMAAAAGGLSPWFGPVAVFWLLGGMALASIAAILVPGRADRRAAGGRRRRGWRRARLGLADAAGLPATAGLRAQRRAVPPGQCGDAAAGREEAGAADLNSRHGADVGLHRRGATSDGANSGAGRGLGRWRGPQAAVPGGLRRAGAARPASIPCRTIPGG
ncbi:hypothetical protein [Dankookia sp. P2]|uniref:hypothetical protein n=1 Tax=Dankookia sp. P2 TaxID=3423955 RepID=UPI003D66F47E